MVNWAITDYVIEGPKEILKKIYDAIKHHDVQKDSSDNWEGNILNALGIKWEERKMEQKGNQVKFSGYYLRGFISEIDDIEFNSEKDIALRFYAEEAWGKTDFNILLEQTFPDIKVYWVVEEESEDIYATNDKEGKYFTDRYYVDTCIDGNYEAEYFSKEDSMYKWLSHITGGRVKNLQDVEDFNADYEDSDGCDENYIEIHKYDVCD